jgi:hypothetical protein
VGNKSSGAGEGEEGECDKVGKSRDEEEEEEAHEEEEDVEDEVARSIGSDSGCKSRCEDRESLLVLDTREKTQ